MWLKEPRIADVVVSALIHGDIVRASYDLFSWVVMPNHVHVVLKPHQTLAGDHAVVESCDRHSRQSASQKVWRFILGAGVL